MAFSSMAPVLYTQNGVSAQKGNVESLKGSHVSFNGYGLDIDETVTFGEFDDYKSSDSIRKIPTYPGSKKYSILVRVTRTRNGVEKDSWFNIGVLSRQMSTAEGKSIPVDNFRAEMIALDDDYNRLVAVAGKSIKGLSEIQGFSPVFERSKNAQGITTFTVVKNEDGSRKVEPATYVEIGYVE